MWFFKIKGTALRKKKKKDCIFIITGIKRSERLVSCSYWGLTHYSWVRVPCRQVTQSPPLLTGLHPTWFLWAFSAQPRKKEEGPSELSPTLWFNRINERGTSALPIPTNSPQIPMISEILLYSGSDFNTYKTFFSFFLKQHIFLFLDPSPNLSHPLLLKCLPGSLRLVIIITLHGCCRQNQQWKHVSKATASQACLINKLCPSRAQGLERSTDFIFSCFTSA